MSAPQLCEEGLRDARANTAGDQSPWATVLTCSDSRVSPELIFGGAGIGELFVARNAGNVADTAVMGTIEYGAEHLGSPLVVVLGHQRCGAVQAACDVVAKHVRLEGSIRPMVDAIVPAARSQKGKPGDFVDNAVRENARRNAAKILAGSGIVKHLVHEGKVKVVYARYDLDSGVVAFLLVNYHIGFLNGIPVIELLIGVVILVGAIYYYTAQQKKPFTPVIPPEDTDVPAEASA